MEPMNQPGRRVAFFGGSFDPPHLGHMAVARAARAALRLDTVLFVPVGAQPLKSQGATASYEDRLAMTQLAIAGEQGFEISLADAPKLDGAPNYTLETLRQVRTEIGPSCSLFFLMGADSFFGLRNWHRASEIPFAADLIVASRPGQSLEDLTGALPPGLSIEPVKTPLPEPAEIEVRAFLLRNRDGQVAQFYLLPGLDFDVSASEIRTQIRDQDPQTARHPHGTPAKRALLARAVQEYVQRRGLYR